VKGDPGMTGELETSVAGSFTTCRPNPESERSPFPSINFVTCHDGFHLERPRELQ